MWVVLVLLIGAPLASAGTSDVGTLKSADPTTCSASISDDEQKVHEEQITIKVDIKIEEDNLRKDKWETTLDVEWQSWPEGASPPPDRSDDEAFTDTKAHTDVYNSELKVQWNSDAFDVYGTYEASVNAEIIHSDRDWDGEEPNWTERCKKSGEGKVTIEWLAEEITIIIAGEE